MTLGRPIRVLELRSVRGMGGGPEKTILHGAARADPARFTVIVCYIRDKRDHVFNMDVRAKALQVEYVEIEERHSFDLSAWRTLRRLVREQRIDIVHAHEYKTDLIAAFLARTEGVLPLATVHGWSGHSRRERWLYYPCDRRLLARFPHVIAVSSDIARMLMRAGVAPERVTTIVNGIDHTAFRRDPTRRDEVRRSLGVNSSDFVVGAVGRIEREKRYDLLVNAIARVTLVRPNIRLFIAGDGALRAEVEAAARVLCPADTCVFLGHRTDVAALYHAFDLFVQSSDNEGTPNAVLEAMALETPVVATNVGGTSDLLEDGEHALLVPRRDVVLLAAAIEFAFSDPVATQGRASRARRRIEEHLSFDARMRAVEAVYDRLMDERAPGNRVGARQCA